MNIRPIVPVLVVTLAAVPLGDTFAAPLPVALGAPAVQNTNQRESREARENAEILKEADEEINEFALALLHYRYGDSFLQEYVNELGQSLVPRETPAGILFSFRVLNSRVPNALALPDGRIFINSGLLAFVQNEAQLTMILGHEIGHVLEQHYVESVRQARRSALLNTIVGGAAGAVLGGIFGGRRGAAEAQPSAP